METTTRFFGLDLCYLVMLFAIVIFHYVQLSLGSLSSNSSSSDSPTSTPELPPPLSSSKLSVEMICESTTMTALVEVQSPFKGRVFAMSHSHQCFSTAVNEASNQVVLTMPLHGGHCGTKNLGNGTFINSLVVQHHPFILRNTDRRIDVACDYQEVKRKLRGGKQVLEGDTLTMTQVITGLAPTPPIKLRVVNSTGDEVRGVELGDPLFLKVEMLDETVFGIFGSELVARSGDGSESILLIDDNGCPVEPGVFPALKRSPERSKSLVAPFQAFRFASDAAVKFQLTVSFCLDTCQPVTCEFNETMTERSGNSSPSASSFSSRKSFGRRRKRRETFSSSGESAFEEFQSGDIVTDVTMETSVFVVNNLKKIDNDNQQKLNQPKQQRNNDDDDFSMKNRFSLDPFGFGSGIHLGFNGICFSPLILYGSLMVGCIAQATIFGLCVWVLIYRRNLKSLNRERGRRSFSSSSKSSYKSSSSSRASITSKTGLYDS